MFIRTEVLIRSLPQIKEDYCFANQSTSYLVIIIVEYELEGPDGNADEISNNFARYDE
jgi:hypothetical protein